MAIARFLFQATRVTFNAIQTSVTKTGPLVNLPAGPFSKTSLFMQPDPPYIIYIRADSLNEITEQALHLVYFYLARSLEEHRRQGRNGDYEAFAVEVLALLQRYRHLYTET